MGIGEMHTMRDQSGKGGVRVEFDEALQVDFVHAVDAQQQDVLDALAFIVTSIVLGPRVR
jgi:hypothetical protein